MKALVLAPEGPAVVDDHPEPRPAAGEVVLGVRLAGICATDLELVRGYKGGFRGVLGHEFVGEVLEVGDGVENGWTGRRVVASINLGCGVCPDCRRDGPEHCSERRVLGILGRDGTFAERLAVPAANLFEVPGDLDDEQAVFTEPLAAAFQIRRQVQISSSARTAVLGPGRLGLLVGQVLALDGGRPVVLGRRAASLELPRRLGLATGLAADAEPEAFDLVVDTTGVPAGFAEALRLVRPRGTIVLKSTYAAAAGDLAPVDLTPIDLTPVVVDEIRVVGSRCGPFAPALRLLADGAVEVCPLIDATYALADGLQALEHAGRTGVRKVLLAP